LTANIGSYKSEVFEGLAHGGGRHNEEMKTAGRRKGSGRGRIEEAVSDPRPTFVWCVRARV
jgi:hypothetical protein